MHRWRGRLPLASAIAGLTCFLAACGGASPAGTGSGSASRPAAQSGKASPSTLKPLTFGIEVISATQLPAWVALDGGYFKQYGLDVKEVLMGTAAKTTAGLLSGGVDMAYLDVNVAASTIASGSNLVVVGDQLSTLPFWIYGGKGITQLSQLKGKKFGIPSVGSSADLAARCAMQKEGMNPQRDVVLTSIGGQPQVVAALDAGAIAGGTVVPPFTFVADRDGLHDIVLPSRLGCPNLASQVTTTRTFLKQHPQRVVDFLKAHLAAIHRILTDKAFAVSVLMHHTKVKRKTAEETYQKMLPLWAKPGKEALSDQTVQQILQLTAQVMNPAVGSVRPSQVLDYSAYDGLIRSGFVGTLK